MNRRIRKLLPVFMRRPRDGSSNSNSVKEPDTSSLLTIVQDNRTTNEDVYAPSSCADRVPAESRRHVCRSCPRLVRPDGLAYLERTVLQKKCVIRVSIRTQFTTSDFASDTEERRFGPPSLTRLAFERRPVVRSTAG